ncbi:hypothetical protein PROFUN_08051 [Planoprotostelium fungivorum]|uniref:folate gamma-glutamyl hydrolase n=1 Tax=Planoprotostelium fungivorum TaxID=1890364 RepID=A0A2P6NKK4_9EUKA|nr:hypothetical protein PROFUN_08051 [Planoprotostelium fungivorum]
MTSYLPFLFILVASVLSQLNDRPVIGILDQPAGDGLTYRGNTSYLAANYVKWVESSGARVVPVWFNSSKDKLKEQFSHLNGYTYILIPTLIRRSILFTGGDLVLSENATYVETARYLLQLALEENDRGVHFPVWGTCQGFELLSVLIGGEGALELQAFDAENLSLPLTWSTEADQSRMLADMSDDIYVNLENLPLTINLHHDGVYPQTFQKNNRMRKFFRMIAQNVDRKGTPFASVMEGRKYPVYGVQFHPERNAFEWNVRESVSHSRQAIRASQYFGDFFVDEARKNDHRYDTAADEAKALIYNYNPYYSEDSTDSWPDEQTYAFQWQ